MSDDKRPKVDLVTASYFRKGKCAACGGSVERSRSFSGSTMLVVSEKARVWSEETALLHKRCEGFA